MWVLCYSLIPDTHNPPQYQVPKQESRVSLQGNSFLPPPSWGSQPSGKLNLNRMENWQRLFSNTNDQTVLFRFLIDVYLYCVWCYGFPNVPQFPVITRWHVRPNIHCFCTAGARAIFWFLLILDQWNYVKHVSCALIFLPHGLILCRFVYAESMARDRDAAPTTATKWVLSVVSMASLSSASTSRLE